MATINYSLTPVSTEITGGDKLWRANVQTNGTVDADALAQKLADKTKQDKSLAVYFLNALNEELEKQILAGYRVNLGQLSTGFAIKGAFLSADDRFDPARHQLVATIRTLDPLKSALDNVSPENVLVALACSVYSLMDNVTKELNCVTGTNEIHVQGVNLGIDTGNADEHVRFLDAQGFVKATAAVTASDAQTITCHLETALEAGVYTLEVSCRNGNRESLAPAVATLKNVVVKAA